jgi:hypothetical protein
MANLSLSQVRDAVERKRRRDLGSLRNPMDIMEGQYGLNDPSNPYLQGIDKAGLRNMTSAREVPSVFHGENIRGQAHWGGRTGPQDWRPNRDIRILGEGLLSPEEYEDTMTHEVGHLGEQAVGNYRNWGDDVEDRSHNMLYGRNVGGVFDPNDPYFGTTEERGILSDRLGGDRTLKHVEGRHDWVDVDPMDAQERLADINRKSKFEGLLGQDTVSTGSESFIPAPVRSGAEDIMTSTKSGVEAIIDKFGARTKSGIGGETVERQDEEREEDRSWPRDGSHWGSEIMEYDAPPRDGSHWQEREEIRPTTLKQAQAQGKAHFWHDGKKKLAVTADQLAKFKKSDLYDADSKKSALSQWANIAQSEGGMKKLFKKKSDKKVAAKVKETKADKQFLDDYMQTYYTGKKKDDPEFRENVKARLKGTVPEAQKKTVANAISSAVKIFGTDKLASGGRMDKATMKKMLQDLGQIESGYRTRIAGGGRPERGFWQVLPSTAKDALTNAGAYFGPTFNKTFAGRDWVKSGQSPYESLKNMSQKDISKLLESDDALGAAFSAVQVLRTFKKKK